MPASLRSAFPIAVDADLIGEYPAQTKSGGGYFYDAVLEYRVWVHPHDGGEDLYDGDDYYCAFATFEEASAYCARRPEPSNRWCWCARTNASTSRSPAATSTTPANV